MRSKMMWNKYKRKELKKAYQLMKKFPGFSSLTMEYKSYTGSIELSKKKGFLFSGKVLGIPALISYEGKTMAALEEDFHTAINNYLACKIDRKE